jgi:gamma-glutamyl:cysteine ligase YbdK (ATP-grasp superfamily)
MGQEIDKAAFADEDFLRFAERLAEETALLSACIQQGRCSSAGPVTGFELEAWLVDEGMQPAPANAEYLQALADPLASPELAKFNVEFNYPPLDLTGSVLSLFHTELENRWRRAYQVARSLDLHLLMIGILPTLRDEHLVPANMSSMKRYHALNEQILRRTGKSIGLDISGRQYIRCVHRDVMLEAATTSFQIHLQYPLSRIRHVYNAAIVLSAPMVAVSQNSPFLFGRDLWGETRIALFEQSIPGGGSEVAGENALRRVSFGSGYARHDIGECFEENRTHFPVLLPICCDLPPESFFHLKLHNGTIWRWNRPLVGFDPDGGIHIRVEHRVMPSGPTIIDSVANAALYFGLIEALGVTETELPISFAQAQENFYEAAKHGLATHLTWAGGKRVGLRSLLLRRLIPMARTGLMNLRVDTSAIDRFLGIIEARVGSGMTGAEWQRRFMLKHPHDFESMTAAFLDRQLEGRPVHEWTLD